ncbi:hypothetical protein LshimejAT787_1601050 [Lyophyllum shimeji]|uniref:Uncharacterized protein n=1 Tax=Lyophyllum shimeji TaxID=47721 RepID=A0A9P3PWC3_LYOSH|nr:hypothetical protein LshimejAT787_1601050 [Lyophyllum shimeji]
MSGNGEQEMPARKRRRVMEAPDGFDRPKPVNVPKPNVHVPKFSSAFEENIQPTPQKPPSKPRVDPGRLFGSKQVQKPVLSLKNPATRTDLKQLPVPTFPLAPKKKEKNSTPTFRIPPPPDPRAAAKSEPSSTTNPQRQLRPAPPPPLPLPLPPNAAPARPSVPLKDLFAPTIFAPADTTLDKSMRTISTTEIALATDLSTDSGTAELAHIFLRDQHPELAASNKEELPEWNLGMSPQKGAKFAKGKGKEAKFVKGGLAARASELMARSHTSLALWHKETELLLASSSRRLSPDLRLRIVKIVDSPAGAKPSSPRKRTFSVSAAMTSGVAVCRVVSIPSSKQPAPAVPRIREQQYHLVVFSFPTIAPPRLRGQKRIYARNPEDFVVGREVCIWGPWLDVSLSSRSASPDDAPYMKVDPEIPELAAAPFPTLPSTYPRPPSPLEAVVYDDTRTADTVLMCSRFVILP